MDAALAAVINRGAILRKMNDELAFCNVKVNNKAPAYMHVCDALLDAAQGIVYLFILACPNASAFKGTYSILR
ncbi:hypothetical protein [Glaciimonas sp. PCH181]|uniref:hypothetical protein n=1 Tax=Glaciimonas sp. PCH181 TaxID=2133943 RepID=UPI000D3B9924|nr:hypothetical protein [Glaciimonas sp. PCH181]PUA18405.1 hypothetical protein C7W93_00050 [Glaciimonas sp. PCH181]